MFFILFDFYFKIEDCTVYTIYNMYTVDTFETKSRKFRSRFRFLIINNFRIINNSKYSRDLGVF